MIVFLQAFSNTLSTEIWPYDYRGMVVPDNLMSGHYEKIRQWRLYESLKKTYERRPDLF